MLFRFLDFFVRLFDLSFQFLYFRLFFVDLLLHLVNSNSGENRSFIVRDVMKTDLVTVSPQTSSLKALLLMREKNIGCLPVVKNKKLLGLITSQDFLTVSTKLFEERLREKL